MVKYVELNKANDNDFFTIECNPNGTRWTGRCWFVHELLRYEFDLEFDMPVS